MSESSDIWQPTTDEDWMSLEMDIRSLYTPSGPIDEELFFAGRTIQIRQLLEAAIERSLHAVIFGDRGIGKTSLANIFWRRFSKRLASIVVARVQADPSDNFASLWAKALRQLRRTAVSIGKEDLVPIREDFDVLTPDDVRLELEKCRANAIPIIVIDEFDKLEDAKAIAFTANLIKMLSDFGVNCTIIIVGVAESLSDLIDEHESIKRCIVQVPLERMNNSEITEIITSRLKQTPMSIDGVALDRIVFLARGLPFYAHTLAKFSAISAIDGRDLAIVPGDVTVAMKSFIDEKEHSFKDEYRRATYSSNPISLYEEVLLACAMAETDAGGFFNASAIIEPLSKILGKPVTTTNFQRNLAELISADRGPALIRRGEPRQHRYRFADPMMQPYVLMDGINRKLIDEQSIPKN